MMRAALLKQVKQPLEICEIPIPIPNAEQVQIKVNACAVCRTDLHIVDGELNQPKAELIPGHQIVGHVTECGSNVQDLKVGDRVGVSWLGFNCGTCEYCLADQENLCDHAKFTGYSLDGGFTEYTLAFARHCYKLPDGYPDFQAAPLLCAGAVGFRAYKKIANAKKLGIYGFGSAAHILTQLAVFQNKQIYAFTSPGDINAQQFALKLGACWAGDSMQTPPELLDAAIIFAPVGSLIPQALAATRKGGIVVCGGIHMSEIPAFNYDLLWGERILCSVANLKHEDGVEFLELAPQVPVHTQVTKYSLSQINQALDDLRNGRVNGAIVVAI
jgi:alcohol dehydrogenase, propanol-preferring